MHSMHHRGPDSQGAMVAGLIGLGHQRLSIIDLSDTGRQPMTNSTGTKWIVFNGEIYNYLELKQELESQGERFRSSSDTEVLLRLFDRLGAECLTKLRGMFAFAIWNSEDQTLFVARDRIGIKPLYYYASEIVFVFGSEIKALLQVPAVPRSLSPEGLVNYFTFGHSVAPTTIYRGVYKLLPGHYLICTRRGLRVQSYWDIPSAMLSRPTARNDAAQELRTRLQDAVATHMVSDVPVGAFLSGGIDSSAIVAFMTRVTNQRVKTFAVGFDVGGQHSELNDAKLVATHFNTEHYETIVSDFDVEALLERLVYHYDEPFADAAGLPTLIISEFARRHVKVILSGDGGDELFGGYRRYAGHQLRRYFQLIPVMLRDSVFRRLIKPTPRLRRLSMAIEAMSIKDAALSYGSWLTMLTEQVKAELLSDLLRQHLEPFRAYTTYRNYYDRFSQGDALARALYTDLKGWLPDTYLEKIDKATMAVSLEGRVPFLDHHLVEYAFGLYSKWKVHGWQTKCILKTALRGVLPEATISKPKHGFTVPLNEWFRGKLKRYLCDVVLDHSSRHCDYLNVPVIENLIQQHTKGKRDLGIQLWVLLNFALWYRQFLASRSTSPPLPLAGIVSKSVTVS